jgi:hypothetical protein
MDDATSPSRAEPDVLDSPVFVDGSGRRRRWLLRTTYGLGAVCVLYMGGLVYSLAAGTISPSTTTLPGARALAPIADALQPLVASANVEPDTTRVRSETGSVSRSADSQPTSASPAASTGTVPVPATTAAGSIPVRPGVVRPSPSPAVTATPTSGPAAPAPTPEPTPEPTQEPTVPSPSAAAPPPTPEPTSEPDPVPAPTPPADPTGESSTVPAPSGSPVGSGA